MVQIVEKHVTVETILCVIIMALVLDAILTHYKVCNSDNVENELHFICVCTTYSNYMEHIIQLLQMITFYICLIMKHLLSL